ncbi:MAG: DUF1844 domain-containing protein [Smithellaceae bacterium]|jgi:hypothetical protein|nr:DUF1844 domain-containing protein [Smithellaceae bacterium]MDD3258971.1 DUF1844 domain-containing protein [Smithellaceae bacterium]MDD3848983.1 DUF1844 domain-containing protein [Smithellaceae bacterium]HOG11343.1 DUF1844 domain-containing protein [Smithellaceae bacterium]HOQ72073.1 DUF1844 domain-containing protein [Smithellaceae bacterium]
MAEETKGEGFVIKDRRFSEEPDTQTKEEPASAKTEEPKETAGKTSAEPADYPAVNFTNFVISLSTSALFHFGDFPEYEGGKAEKNLPAAKQTIDILDMLQKKTAGNLDPNEAGLIEGVLYELKMRYVKEKG